MTTMASPITSLTIVYSTVYSDAYQRKHQSFASLAFVWGEFPAQRASYAENISIWWRHHDMWNAYHHWYNTLRPRQNGRHFADDTFKRIFLRENDRISIEISLNFVPKSPIDIIPTLFQKMAWRQPDDKPLSEAMMVSLLTHICVARPQWVNILIDNFSASDIKQCSNINYCKNPLIQINPWHGPNNSLLL